MSDDRIEYSGGELRIGPGETKRIVMGSEAWNRDPLPKPPPPKKYTYKLTVKHVDGNAVATAETMEKLIEFETQMRQLGYEFIKLERLEEE